MEYILSRRGLERLAQFASSKVLLAFDFDGTLAPIVRDPAQASIRAGTRTILRSLTRLYPCIVISGRSRADVRSRVAGLGFAEVIGNHGAEDGRDAADVRARVKRWRRVLENIVGPYRGVWVEDKQFSLAVHYRGVRDTRRVRASILDAVSQIDGARSVGGKQVVNVVAAGAPHKGMALDDVRARLRCDTAIYVGDDETDEDVFARDRPGELLTVRVGEDRSSRARFFLRNQPQVDRFLRVLVSLRRTARPRAAERTARTPVLPSLTVEARDGRPAPPLGTVLDFMRLLWAIDHSLQRTSKQMAATLGLTAPQRLVIRIVGRFPSIAAGRLANLLYLHPSTLTGILARLESAGVLDRRRDPRDGRRAMLALTAAGRKLDVSLAGTVEDAVQRTLSLISPADLVAARTVLNILYAELHATAGRGGAPR